MSVTSLSGKTAFVSGSSRNIGRAIALELAGRGANVVVNGVSDRAACESVAAAVEDSGAGSLICMGDVSKPETVRAIAEEALARFGTVDILVNNAAVRPHLPFLDMKTDDWQSVIDLDLTASFHTCQAFMPGMVARGWGRVINLTGMKAIRGYVEGAAISAAKHGLWGLTKAISQELAGKGITANAVSPGPIAGEDTPASKLASAANIPVGHLGAPTDIAAIVGFLASEEGRFINGQMIASNGGAAT